MLISIIFILFTSVLASELDNLPEVTIPNGKIQGFYKEALNGHIYEAFEGIPYAKPPIGQYRFREPEAVTPWRGVWNANQTIRCIQYQHFLDSNSSPVYGQEDCLYLNIYRPKNRKIGKLLDVIIHIHGGAFMFGAGSFWGSRFLLEHNIIYVSMNYRLGPLGFLTTESNLVPGNIGLKDQAFALKWIQDNIEYFGGNHNSVTITGLSAGGASVTYHMLSPLSKGLFHKAIAVSGVHLNPWTMMENGLEKTNQLARSVGCYDSVSMSNMIDCMRERPAQQLVQNVQQFMKYLYNPFSPFGVVIEKWGKKPFLPDSPYTLIKEKKINDVPLILSATKDEGLYPAAEFVSNSKYLDEINNTWSELAPHILDYYYTLPQHQHAKIANDIRKMYLGKKPINLDNFSTFVKIISDRLFTSDIEHTAILLSKKMQSPIYLYYFSYQGDYSFTSYLSKNQNLYGVSHADDMLYIFSLETPYPSYSEKFLKMKYLLTSMWVNFAKYGTVNEPIEIQQFQLYGDKFNYLHIESPDQMSMKRIDSFSNRQFWFSIPFDEIRLSQSGHNEL